jgi:hypothetical protein
MGGSELSNKVLGYAERNIASTFEFAQRLVQVKDRPGPRHAADGIHPLQAMTEQAKESLASAPPYRTRQRQSHGRTAAIAPATKKDHPSVWPRPGDGFLIRYDARLRASDLTSAARAFLAIPDDAATAPLRASQTLSAQDSIPQQRRERGSQRSPQRRSRPRPPQPGHGPTRLSPSRQLFRS